MGDKDTAKRKREAQRAYEKKSGYSAVKKYDESHTVFIGLKLNINTDSDILTYIADKAKQTEIKRLVRRGIESEKKQ